MNISEIKQFICTERASNIFSNLPMEREYQNVQLPDGTFADPKVIPPVATKWHRYWENTTRTNVIADDDVMNALATDPTTNMLRYTYKWIDSPKGGGEPYHHYQIIFMKNVVMI